MKRQTIVSALYRLAFAVSIFCVSCSDVPRTNNKSASLLATPTFAAHTTAATSTSASGANAASIQRDYSWAASVNLPPGTTCTVYPEGISNDPTLTDSIVAGADGEVRFYAPPQAWGTRLTLDCNLNGRSQGQHLVDLNDSSTFKRELTSDLAAAIKAKGKTIPALTGDLTSLSPADFVQRGYPPPPDRATQSQRYNQWAQSVSKPSTQYTLVNVFNLGLKMTGQPEFSPCNNVWTGFDQAAVGFNAPCVVNFANDNSQLYEEYVAQLYVPNSDCSLGPCGTGVWAGIGGAIELSFFGTQFTSDLIQNGFVLIGTNNVQFFWEFWRNGPSSFPTAGLVATQDNIDLIGAGWSGETCVGSVTPSAPWACFRWFDTSNNTSYLASMPNPNVSWWPATTEYVVEVPPGSPGNARYSGVTFTGAGIDWNGNWHPNPGSSSATDPFQNLQQGDFNNAVWANGTPDNALNGDPMSIFFDNYQ
jgi:hypothetical protein